MSPRRRFDLVLRSQRVVLPDGEQPAAVCVSGGVVAAILPYGAPVSAAREVDLGSLAVLPGLVDTHVHVNEPGRTEWEGFDSATRAAALGGVTTLIDMPLNSIPPTTTPDALAEKRAAAKEQISIDVGFWGGAVPGNRSELAALYDAGAFGFKCFLADSGVPEFPALDAVEFEATARRAAELGALLIVHAEDQHALDQRRIDQHRGNERVGAANSESGGAAAAQAAPVTEFASFLASRPDAAESAAVTRVLAVARRTGARVHILHLSSAESLPLIAEAKAGGVRVTVETCPHYLFFAAEDIPNAATEYKCCPPIRSAANREQLWAALDSGVIDFVVSDHSPCAPELKQRASGDFATAWGGIASVQLGLPVVWTEARQRGWTLGRIAELMAMRPADFVGLPHKGRIAVGCDADLVVFDPDAEFTVDGATLAHRHPVTPYQGSTLTGVVQATYLRGRLVDDKPYGKLLRRIMSGPRAAASPEPVDGVAAVATEGEAVGA
ncbi:allantoinase AllB [Actinocrinis sp.]|uniref:allantoinase AllB n=1 Tax=Actinocrinis sp. TaxID=1920516 RepID=UPI002D6CA651|nr:allantoinase AllB [Actinocrinis sp.]HZP50808.1 allantoinase AllB [Actinocrinis sp.]